MDGSLDLAQSEAPIRACSDVKRHANNTVSVAPHGILRFDATGARLLAVNCEITESVLKEDESASFLLARVLETVPMRGLAETARSQATAWAGTDVVDLVFAGAVAEVTKRSRMSGKFTPPLLRKSNALISSD